MEAGAEVPLKYPEEIRHLALSPDGLIVATASDDGTVRFWNALSGGEMLTDLNHATWCYGVAFSPDGERVATTSQDGTIRLWDITATTVPRLHVREGGEVLNLAYSPDGKRFVTLTDRHTTARAWDAETGRPLTPPLLGAGTLGNAVFSPDGEKFALMSEYFIGAREGARGAWIYSAQVGASQLPIGVEKERRVRSADFDSTSTWVATTAVTGEARVWNAGTGDSVLELPFRSVGAAFLPNTNHLALTSGNVVRVVEIPSGNELYQLPSAIGDARQIFYYPFLSPDGRYLAAGASDQSLHLWDLKTRRPVSAPLFHSGSPVWAAFARESNFVVTFGLSDAAKVWKIGVSEPFLPALRHESSVFYAGFSSNGDFILSASADATVRLWDHVTGDLVDIVSHGSLTVGRLSPVRLEYLTGGSDWRTLVWRPEPCRYSPEQIASLAEVLGARQMDQHGSTWPLTVQNTSARLEQLKEDLPRAFVISDAQRAFWHEQMIGLASANTNWVAVVKHADRAMELQPELLNDPTADRLFETRANALAELGRFDEAAAGFARAVELEPGSFLNWEHWLAALLAQNLTNDYSEGCWQLLGRFGWLTNHPALYRNEWMMMLANSAIYAKSLPDYSIPLAMATQLATEYPQWTGIRSTRGILLYRMSQSPEAIQDLQRGDQEDPTTRFFHAMALHWTERSEEAREQFKEGRRLLEQLRLGSSERWPFFVLHDFVEAEAARVLGLSGG
jgi:WD40 repeat protein/tetratricopeptide (TPR) repeat protein